MKKTVGRILCAALIAVMLLSLTACGKGGWDIRDIRREEQPAAVVPENGLDAQQLLAELTYIPQMFYGDHYLAEGKDSEKAYMEQSDYWEAPLEVVESFSGEPRVITAIPFRVVAGPGSMNHKLAGDKSRCWAEFYFRDNNENMVTVKGAISVEDNSVLCFTPVNVVTYNYDSETDVITYELTDTVLKYDFAFSGQGFTLSKDGKTVTLEHVQLTDYYDFQEGELTLHGDCNVSAGSPLMANITNISYYNTTKKKATHYISLKVADGEEGEYYYVNDCSAHLGDDGILTINYTDKDGQRITCQALAFLQGDDGMILYDGEKMYRYNDTFWSNISSVVVEEDAEKLAELPEETVEVLIEKKDSLFNDLAAALEQAGINATVNSETGEIALDSAVLFAVNESTISPEGEAFLTTFWQVYTDVVSGEEYSDFVSKIMVEGHADPSGNYEHNLVLSQARADAVKDFCLASGQNAQVGELLEAVGYSSNMPVYDENGIVDMAASRRVAFRFLISIE